MDFEANNSRTESKNDSKRVVILQIRVLQTVAVCNTMNASDVVSISTISIFVGLTANGISQRRLIIQLSHRL